VPVAGDPRPPACYAGRFRAVVPWPVGWRTELATGFLAVHHLAVMPNALAPVHDVVLAVLRVPWLGDPPCWLL